MSDSIFLLIKLFFPLHNADILTHLKIRIEILVFKTEFKSIHNIHSNFPIFEKIIEKNQ